MTQPYRGTEQGTCLPNCVAYVRIEEEVQVNRLRLARFVDWHRFLERIVSPQPSTTVRRHADGADGKQETEAVALIATVTLLDSASGT